MQILSEDERLLAMQRLARAYHEAAPALFLVEQVDLYAHRPDLRHVRLRNRVPMYEEIEMRRSPP
jgi:peptide/nickel transport system substrate-binding protein